MQEALVGKTLGRYQLQRRVGQGGMADVYLAHDEYLHRDVAVKVVHRGQTDDLARFQREAATLAPLTHEHILPVYDYGQEGPWHYLVMPYVSHGTLADRLRTRGPLTPAEAGLLLEQVASALQYAHDHGILHRDIKTSNILLRDDFYAYLADFGIAKSLERESGLTQTGTFIGTPEYMAPELFENQGGKASDIYALGIVLYYMLTGRLPFTAPNALAVVNKHFHELPVPPSRLNPAIPPAVEQVILRALEKDPRGRFPSARAFADAYRQALQAPITPATPTDGVTTGFYSDPTLAFQPALVTTPGSRPAVRSAAPGRSMKTRLKLSLIALALCVLLLILGGSLLIAASLNNHTGAAQPSALATTTAAPAPALTPTPTQPATTCTVNDPAGILDKNQICQRAQALPYSLIITTSNASGDSDSSNSFSVQSINAKTIVIKIAISRAHHGQQQVHVTITGGSEVQFTSAQYHSAVEAFNRAVHGGHYTAATIAAIQSLQTSSD
jgi:serine/threonine protein kinase